MAIERLLVIHGGELAKDVAEQIERAATAVNVECALQCCSERPKKLATDVPATTLAVFVMQTIENAQPTEEGGATLRFFKRKTHPSDMLSSNSSNPDGLQYTVLGVGDSNLLLDRQTTGAADCNQVAQELDRRLEQLGATRRYPLGLDDERAGLTQVEGWISGLLESVRTTLPPSG